MNKLFKLILLLLVALFDKFLFAALPFMVVIGGVIMVIRGQSNETI